MRRPKAVTEATADYLADEDAIAAWLEECCEVNANASDSPARIYASWKAYAREAARLQVPSRLSGQSSKLAGLRRRNAATESVPTKVYG